MACQCLINITHIKAVAERILLKLIDKFRKDNPLTTTRGKLLEYLRMSINYRKTENFLFSMKEYIRKILEEVLYDMNGTAKTPVANHLFNINDGAMKLQY